MTWKAEIRWVTYQQSCDVFVGRPLTSGGYERLLPVGECQVETISGMAVDPLAETPFLRFRDQSMLQAIVDACWEAGIRPSQHQDFKDVYDAQGKHLDDMRQLVTTMSGAPLVNTNPPPPMQYQGKFPEKATERVVADHVRGAERR